MKRINKITKKVIASKNLTKAAQAAFVCNKANKVFRKTFDNNFLKEIKIHSYSEDRGFLYVLVPNSFYSQEIKLVEEDIIKETNQELKENLVKKIFFKTT